jgi:hypothetical protein
MSIQSHIQRLRDKHASLEASIIGERARPWPDETITSDLKHKKLKIKDEIIALSGNA